MRVVGHSMNSSYSHQAKTCLPQSELIHETGVQCTGDVFVTQTFVEYGTESECHRPRIVLAGRLLNIKGAFPGGINSIEFEESDQPDVIMHYDLSNAQIARMYENNIFPDREQLAQFLQQKNDGFVSYPETIVTPDIMNMNKYEDLPMTCSYLMVKDTTVPIIFVQPENQYNIQLDASCGYELVDYLEPFTVPEYHAPEFENFEEFVDEDQFVQDERDEKPIEQNVQPKELTEDEKIAQDIFSVTKPRVDEHVEKDKAYIQEMRDMVEEMNMDETSDSADYESEFERMMYEDMDAESSDSYDDTADVSESADTLDETMIDVDDFDGPLNVQKVIERKRKAAEIARKAAEQNEAQNGVLNKTMPANLSDIQSHMDEDDKQAGE